MIQNKKIQFEHLGLIDYKEAWDYQEKLFKEILELKAQNRNAAPEAQQVTPNHLLFCYHPHVYTLGKSGHEEHLLLNKAGLEAKGATYYKINRGGDITYHGPGQIVGYPILDLESFFTDIHKYLRFLEEAVILTLQEYGIAAGRISGLTGVWLDHEVQLNPRKICAMGVKCSRWVTMHGFAFNINTDLDYFNNIVPCGISDKQVTSLAKELGHEVELSEVEAKLTKHLASLLKLLLRTYYMKKDIDFGAVEGIAVAVATAASDTGEPIWNVYLLNYNPHKIENVLVSSKGYGQIEGSEVKTSVLRHMFEEVEGKSFVQIEPIDPAIFHINNEYWVSYYINDKIYDKKFVFVPDSITEENLIEIGMLQLKGVLHS